MTEEQVKQIIQTYLEDCYMRVTTTKELGFSGEHTRVVVTIYDPNGSIILADSDIVYA